MENTNTADAMMLEEEKKKARHRKKVSAYIKKYFFLFLGSIITAIGLEIFLVPNNVIDGGF